MKAGLKTAVNSLARARKTSPAYRKLLKSCGIKADEIDSYQNFSKLPIITKENFINKHTLQELFSDQKNPPFIYSSSGSSGMANYWYRDENLDTLGSEMHEKILSKNFGIKRPESTLVIVAFSMGMWIAGNYTQSCFNHLVKSGYNLTIASPGIEMDDVIGLFRSIAPNFKNVILASYPSFLTDIILNLREKRIAFPKNIFYLSGGSKITEEWRDTVLKISHLKNKYRSNSNIYGSAEAAFLGYETPLSIYIKDQARKNKNFYKDLFGFTKDMPGLFQYDERKIFFEQVDNQLVFTTYTPLPLIRYNISDLGSILDYKQMKSLLKKHDLLRGFESLDIPSLKFPFIINLGRRDVMIMTYGLMVYPSQIEESLIDFKTKKIISGNYVIYNKIYKNSQEKLHINIELQDGFLPNDNLNNSIMESVVSNLKKINSEFRKLESAMGKLAWPTVNLFAYSEMSSNGPIGGVVIGSGKKPRKLV